MDCTRSFVLCLKRKHKLFTLSSTKLDLHSQMPAVEIILQTFLVRFSWAAQLATTLFSCQMEKRQRFEDKPLVQSHHWGVFFTFSVLPCSEPMSDGWMEGHQVETLTDVEAWCCTKAKSTTGAFPTCSSNCIQPRQQKSCLTSGENLLKWHLRSYWSLLFRQLYKTFFPTPKIMSEISLGNEQVF